MTFQTEFNNDFKDFKSQIDNLQGQLCTFMDNCFDKELFSLFIAIKRLFLLSGAGSENLKGNNNWSSRGFDQSIQEVEHCLLGRWNQAKMGSLLQTLSWNTSQNSKRLWWLQNQRFVKLTSGHPWPLPVYFPGTFALTETFRHLACSSRLASTSWYCPSHGVLCQTDYPTDEYNKEKRATSNWTWLHENS